MPVIDCTCQLLTEHASYWLHMPVIDWDCQLTTWHASYWLHMPVIDCTCQLLTAHASYWHCMPVIDCTCQLLTAHASYLLHMPEEDCAGVSNFRIALKRATNQKLEALFNWEIFRKTWQIQIFHLNHFWYKLYLKTIELHSVVPSIDWSWSKLLQLGLI